jgi:hypothetical protein
MQDTTQSVHTGFMRLVQTLSGNSYSMDAGIANNSGNVITAVRLLAVGTGTFTGALVAQPLNG